MKTKHHIKNCHRGGKDRDNIVMLPDWFHKAWHEVAGNLTPDEACNFIREVMKPGKEWGTHDLKRFRKGFETP